MQVQRQGLQNQTQDVGRQTDRKSYINTKVMLIFQHVRGGDICRWCLYSNVYGICSIQHWRFPQIPGDNTNCYYV